MLKEFLHNYLYDLNIQDIISLPIEKYNQNIYGVEGFHSYVDYREGQFQVQVFNFTDLKYVIVPEHTHPNVNSYEVGISGDVHFTHGQKWFYPRHPALHYYKSPKTNKKYRCIRVNNTDIHGALIGPKGGIFLSVQQWLNNTNPSCVAMDYDGYGISENQSKIAGVKYKQRTWKMAASKENGNPPWDGFS